MDGKYFATFLHQYFASIVNLSNKNTRRFVQDGDPSQNSALAKAVMQQVDAELFPIPPRSPDINPIEFFLHLVREN